MSFIDYVQSFWGSASTAVASSASGGAGPSAGGVFSPSPSAPSGTSAQHLGSGVWPLSAHVREEMKWGTRYNMKVVLRGTKATGKSTLLARLTSHPLPRCYTPSTELIASTMRLQGEHCAPNEGTKVDIWEAVEEGRQRSVSSSSPNAAAKAARHIPAAQLQEALRVAADARLLDVYSGAHLTIFLIDPRQRASWEYAKQESLHVPPTCCVLYALNFSDAVSPAAGPLPVTLADVEAWCARSRRATTSVVHRMLEGRQAPPEFSVRPMTAVLSALNGTGMMGVVRALHVASTLLRVATEEVRVTRLFELMARQQSVAVEEKTTPSPAPPLPRPSPTPPPSAANAGNSAAAVRDGAPETALPPQHRSDAAGSLRPTGSSLRSSGGATPLPVDQHSPSALRLAHRPTAVSSAHAASTHGGSAAAAASRPALTDAEAMRLFLGGEGSSSSDGDSDVASSASSVSASAAATKARPLRRPGHSAPPSQPRSTTQAELTRSPLAVVVAAGATVEPASGGSGGGEGLALPPPLASTNAAAAGEGLEGVVAAQREADDVSASAVLSTTRPPDDEERVRALAATMVHDARAPDDTFFSHETDASHEGQEATVAAAEAPVADAASSGVLNSGADSGDESGGENGTASASREGEAVRGAPRARPLWTQRVVRRASQIPAAAADASPALQTNVSALLAEMTAALAADTANSSARDAASPPEAAEPREEGDDDKKKRKKKSRKKHSSSSPPHRHSRDTADGERKHGRHRRQRASDTAGAEGRDEAATEVQDDGSFDLVIV